MRHVSASEAKQTLSAMLDAAQREPIVIRRQKRDVAVLLSMHDYERLTAINTTDFQDFCDRVGRRAVERGLTEAKLEELLNDEA